MWDLERNNVYRDLVKSVQVPYGTSITFYDGRTFDGSSIRRDGDMYLGTNNWMRCQNLDGFYDKAASAIVYKTLDTGLAVGKWVMVGTASETFTFTINAGFESSHEASYGFDA